MVFNKAEDLMTKTCSLWRVLVLADPDSSSEFGQGKRLVSLHHP